MKIPVLPTAIVAAAVAVMIGLGVWQLQRAEWKEGLLVRYGQAAGLPPVAWPNVPPKDDPPYYRRATGFCLEVVSWRAVAGRNLNDQPGWSHIAACRTGAEGPGMQVDVGWSRSSDPPQWRGGALDGVIAPDSKYGMRLIAATPAPGLVASAPPSPESVPNNHLAYAIQWFIFAAIAAIIYGLALRWRHKETPGR
ncbi:SURF1 family cytochrome oxidase biogenesis protein [Sphingomonas sp.]|uniref:SURF1 family cytochrome oxidase biogenesis protein n=1 Tax=Sphingomonas sp. TaxID=28214 RepID=UPI002FC90571